jgi:branched-chain amino acid transport system substrate-binding protein
MAKRTGFFTGRMVPALVVLAAVAAACSDDSTDSSETADTTAVTEAAGGSEAAGDDEVYRIGFASGQTGYLSVTDGPALRGLELGIAEINAAGGIDGRIPIELTVRNTESDPARTASVVESLIEDGADLIITPCDSDPSVAGGQVSQRAGIPTISICASTPTMRSQVGDFMFGSTYGDNVSGAILAQHARDLGHETAYLHLSTDTQYTLKLVEYFAVAFEELGGEVVGVSNYAIDQQDFSAAMTTLAGLDPQPDVFFTSTYEPQLQALLQQFHNAGVESHFFAAEGMDTPASFSLPPEVIEGVVYTTAAFATPGGALESFGVKYEEFYGEAPGSAFPAIGYDVSQIIAAAVAAAGSTDPTAVRDAILQLENVAGGTGPITYKGREDGMPLKGASLVEVLSGEPSLIAQITPDPSAIPDPTATFEFQN